MMGITEGAVPWSNYMQKRRNLTAWVDQNGRLSLAMAKVTVKRSLDIHTGYDIITTSTKCVLATETVNSRWLRLEFYRHEYSQFGIIETLSHFFSVFSKCSISI